MRVATALFVTLALMGVARANLTGHWRVGFTNVSGGPIGDYCRFDFVESPPGQIQGHLGLCGLGTEGVFSGTLDGSGNVALHIVAPDDIGCTVYRMNGTVAPTMDAIEGTYVCDYPLAGLHGDVVVTRCDPLTSGSCPETSGASLPPRVHEIRACTPAPAAACRTPTVPTAKLKLARAATFHWKMAFTLPAAATTTLPELGDPTTVRDYVACVYQTVAGNPVLLGMEPAWAATQCGVKPCWTKLATGVKYHNRTGRLGKLIGLTAKIRKSGAANVVAKGNVTTVLAPAPGATLGLPVIVQVLADDVCFGASFPTALLNGPDALNAKFGE